MARLLVLASTFPASADDPVPRFVKDQVVAFKQADSSLEIAVLAPHDARSNTRSHIKHADFNEHRFHYFWPFRFEKLAGRGIMPTLRTNPIYYALIPFLFFAELIALFRLAKKFKPDTIYAHWFTPQGIVAAMVGSFLHIKFVFTTHASAVAVWRKITFVGEKVVRYGVRQANAFTAVSSRSMASTESFFNKKEWARVSKSAAIIPMGIYLPEKKKEHSKSNSKQVLFIGRLVEKKGVVFLLAAMSEVLKDHPEAKLTIAGDGPLKNELENEVKMLGIEAAVSFAGFVAGDDKDKLLASADVVVVPSIIASDGDVEGLPVALLEGLAHGKICIATRESGADDIIQNNKNGLLIDQKSTSQLASSLNNSLSMTKSEKSQLAQAARKTAEQFAWPIVAKKHLDLFSEDKE